MKSIHSIVAQDNGTSPSINTNSLEERSLGESRVKTGQRSPIPNFDSKLERIEQVFSQLLVRYKAPWQRRVVLHWTSKLYGISAAEFRKSFELWEVEQGTSNSGGGAA